MIAVHRKYEKLLKPGLRSLSLCKLIRPDFRWIWDNFQLVSVGNKLD